MQLLHIVTLSACFSINYSIRAFLALRSNLRRFILRGPEMVISRVYLGIKSAILLIKQYFRDSSCYIL